MTKKEGNLASTKLQPSDYVHLHNHTHYSLLDGLTKIPSLIERVKELGMSAVAITDHGTLSGAIEFYKKAKDNEINPIIGMEAYVASRRMIDKEPGKDKANYHVILLAMNNKGYQNLMRLSTLANLEGFYYKPRIDRGLLERYNEGLIVLSGCIGGEVGDALRQGQYKQAKEIASWYKQVFGDRYYLEIQDHGHPKHPKKWKEQVDVTDKTFKLAKELGIECVLTSDAHYLKKEDETAHEILLCVQTGSFLEDEKRMSLKDFDLSVADPKELFDRWGKEHPEIIKNTKAIADRCSIEIELGKILIPKFEVPTGETEKSYLHKLVYQGMLWRYIGMDKSETQKLTVVQAKKRLPEEALKRAEYELEVIDQMNFNSYFLIIADFIGWGKAGGIIFGPGRGSAAGSIIAYALNITELDPLKFDLLFERFLNPDRISMPDIDIDIQDTRRDEVIQYCIEKYGKDKVANIVTFGSMAARNAVRDVARVLQVPYADADRLAKMIPPPIQGRHILLSESIVKNPDLKNEYETNKTAKKVFDLAVQLEGTIRSHGVHAAGVVIAPDDIVKFSPLEMAQKGVVTTQYSMGPIEDLGLLKMDFLGLSNLTTIKNTLRIIKKVYGLDIDFANIPLDDEKTYDLLRKGNTTGVFQLESAGMKRYLKELQPTVFDDIVAMVALYRPGPMQWIDDFISRKHGHKQIEYIHDSMEPALKSTYGVIVYQEQVMQISKEMCGFTGGQADTLRKAIGKKKPEELAKLKTDFIEGAVNTVGADRKLMDEFWSQLEDFAAYCFNKAHAACYGYIAYQTAYLKANYPVAFMAALMTSDYDDTDRLAIEIAECQHMDISVQAPDINESFKEFAVVPNNMQIRFGMTAVKNVGSGAVNEILRAREDGQFKSLEDFFSKVSPRTVNRKSIESLVKAGAFDRFENRSKLLSNIDVFLAFANKSQKDLNSGQTDLFGNETGASSSTARLTLIEPETEFTPKDYLQWERELLGIFLSDHPLKDYQMLLDFKAVQVSALSELQDGFSLQVGGMVSEMREITTKNNQKMAFVKLIDATGEIELVVFPGTYEKTSDVWKRDNVLLVKGKIDKKSRANNISNDPKIIVNDAHLVTYEEATTFKPKKSAKKKELPQTIKPEKKTVNQRLYIRLPDTNDEQKLKSIKQEIDNNKGSTEVVLVLGEAANKQIIKLPMLVEPKSDAVENLKVLVGADNIKLH